MKEIAELFEYNPETGEMTRKRTNRFCGYISKHGYRQVVVGRTKKYYQHRIAFYIMTGRVPVTVDHINGDTRDNRWCNLREATQAQQRMNTSGKGYKQDKRTGNWEVYLKGKSLGTYRTEAEAREVRIAAEVKEYGDYSRHA